MTHDAAAMTFARFIQRSNPMQDFPIGGPREPVYAALRSRQFKMGNFGDKHWTRLDGLEVNIHGAGSQLLLRRGGEQLADGPMADVLSTIDALAEVPNVR